MSIDGLTLFTMLACASAGFCGGTLFGGNKVAGLRKRHVRLVIGVRLALHQFEQGSAKWRVMNTLRDALDKDRQITIAIQEDPHTESAGDIPDMTHIRVGERDNGTR